MGKIWKVILWIVGPLGGLIALMAQVPLQTARSNLATYAAALHLDGLAASFPAGADYWATVVGALTSLLAGATLWLSKERIARPKAMPEVPAAQSIGLLVAGTGNVFHNVSSTGFDKGVVLSDGASGNAFSGLRLGHADVEKPDAKSKRHGYDTPLAEAHAYLADLWGVEHGNYQVWDALRSAARAGEIIIWGRPGGNGLNPDHFYKPPENIDPVHWRDFGFDQMRCLYSDDPRRCRTRPDGGQTSLRWDETYADLKINLDEIRARWPK